MTSKPGPVYNRKARTSDLGAQVINSAECWGIVS